MCPGPCVLEFKYSAAPTRRTTVTGVGTGLPNHCLHQANWFYFINPFISSFMCWWTWSLLFEDFDWRLSNFSILILQCVLSHPTFPVFTLSVLCVCLSFHHYDYVVALLCLYLSTYSPTSSSSLRNFLTLKFLSEEFIKSPIHPPSSRRNALSIGIRARYSLVLCDFGLTTWSFNYVDCRNEE